MEYFALTSLIELGGLLVAVFGAFGTILLGFYKYANSREKEFEKSRQLQSQAFDKSIDKLSVSLDKLTEAHIQGNEEAKERNGHLGEQSVEIIKLVNKNHKDTLKAFRDLNIQNVENQNVGHQTITSKE